MATVTPFIRTTIKTKDVNVRFRLTDGRNIQLFNSSEIKVNPEFWDGKRFEIKAKVSEISMPKKLRNEFNKAIQERKAIILEAYQKIQEKPNLTSDLLDLEIDKIINPSKYVDENINQSFFDAFDEFLQKHTLSEVRINNFKVVVRALQRFELYLSIINKKQFVLTLNDLTIDIIQRFNTFLKDEYLFAMKYPTIYEAVPETRTPQQRGQNTLSGMHSKFRTFILWSIEHEKTTTNPYKKYSIPSETYGTPYYISIDERNQLANLDLSHRPQLAKQRDIFVWQCLIGCRVGDLIKLSKNSVINGAIEYIPRKTKEGSPITVRVPLNKLAIQILERYNNQEDEKLLPFISEQKYNEAIKEAFTLAGLNRMVTIINPTTRQEVKQPLNEIASSHLARRCFIGNLYKQGKDPKLVSSLSGHKEGSKAFARYREIDESMKIDLMKLLE